MYVYVIQLLSIFMQFLEALLIRPFVKANAWRAVTSSGAPKRHGHTAVWSPSGSYVFGDADLYCYKVRI